MKYWLSTLFIIISFINECFAQKEANNWYFGDRAAVTFSSNELQSVNSSQMTSIGATSSWSNSKTGALLFYSNGLQVWNSNHNIMPNGNGLIGSSNSTNTSYVVPVPNSQTKFYLFTIKTDPYVSELISRKAAVYYSIIDISLDNNLGDVLSDKKNIFLVDGYNGLIYATHFGKVYASDFGSNRASVSI
ncbi:hypothetical protein LVD15_04260 [Fulvivirga maritima]|uniref:hypothetical protein n=1 Tax=Fulvivirga maritima TaxID=2904247 RepID=UPI001F343827|nr:hypothetical protein [Fulvivirga maritima]UII27646.1 hypothetical protein LVD15_04260 [Fulvivirga maritima]